MLAEIGLVSTLLAFAAALYAIPAGWLAGLRHNNRLLYSARNAALATLPLLVLACVVLLVALLEGHYQINYVRNTTDPQTPVFYRLTALWGAQEGSLLFWSMLMSAFAAGALVLNWRSERRLMPYVISYSMAILVFFCSWCCSSKIPSSACGCNPTAAAASRS
ncbi:hypothetical protein HC928_24645 [bacterium]|nr:hypothetical protein [bacterium]